MPSNKNKKRRSNYVDQPILSERSRIGNYEPVDYTAALSPEEKKWLKKFEREYYYNRGVKKKDKPLHRTKRLRSQLFAQNRVAGEEIGVVAPTDLDSLLERSSGNAEDALIEAIDEKYRDED